MAFHQYLVVSYFMFIISVYNCKCKIIIICKYNFLFFMFSFKHVILWRKKKIVLFFKCMKVPDSTSIHAIFWFLLSSNLIMYSDAMYNICDVIVFG